MQLLYNSDAFAVVLIGTVAAADAPGPAAPVSGPAADGVDRVVGGFEVVDKLARKEIFLQGPVAQSFQRGVKALVDEGPDAEKLDDFIAGFTVLAQHPVVVH